MNFRLLENLKSFIDKQWKCSFLTLKYTKNAVHLEIVFFQRIKELLTP